MSTEGASAVDLTPTFTFDIVLTDPCDPPTSLEVSSLIDDFDFTITDDKDTVSTNIFTISPDFCKFNVLVDIATLAGGQTPITEVTDEVEIEYDTDLAIVGETQKVTITATSYSDF